MGTEITLLAWKHGGWTKWMVTFSSITQALDYIGRKQAANAEHPLEFHEHYSFDELEDHPIVPFGPLEPAMLKLLEILRPTCHHGLSLTICMDPYGDNHWGTREQEMMGML
jgi:hypothetical protein